MSVADILAQLAQNAGRAGLVRGQILGDVIGRASQLPAEIANQREADALLKRGQARMDAQDARGVAQDARQAAADQRDQAAAQAVKDHQAVVNAGLAAAIGDSGDPSHFDGRAAFAAVSKLGKPEAIRDVIAAHRGMLPTLTSGAPGSVMRDEAGQVVPGSAIPEKKADYTVNGQRFSGDGTPIGEAVPTQAAPKSIESKAVLLDGKPALVNYNPTTGRHALPDGTDVSTRVKPIPAASTIVNPTQVDNVKEAVAGMKDGTLPPQMPGRASKDYTAILAEARRQGFDLGKANLDWQATQKHVATMNGAQQLRLNQAINALPDMLDKVDALASSWKGGRFPLLNKANLALAKGGTYGPDVASVATQLDAQIADVTADLGNVYMGGNSPTDHALGLAGKSLNGAWDEKVLHEMVKLAKTNVSIRQNSITHTGVAGASATNPYGNQPPVDPVAPPPKRIVYDLNGNQVKP